MIEQLTRVGTIYLPVADIERASEWYVMKLGAEMSYHDEDKAILNFANQSFFLIKSPSNQSANFQDQYGNEQFSVTFEVDGVDVLEKLHQEFMDRGIKVGEIEDRGHPGLNFVFSDVDGNIFDVWSELSLNFKYRR